MVETSGNTSETLKCDIMMCLEDFNKTNSKLMRHIWVQKDGLLLKQCKLILAYIILAEGHWQLKMRVFNSSLWQADLTIGGGREWLSGTDVHQR